MVDKVRGGTAIYGLYRYVRCEGYGFQAVYSKIRYIYYSVWVQNRGSFFRKLISWLKILSRLGIVVSGLLWLDCASDLSSFWKTAALGQGGFGVFTLVQGNKIQLNWLWCRLRVPGSQRDIPTQKFLKYPPDTVLPLFIVLIQSLLRLSSTVSTLANCKASEGMLSLRLAFGPALLRQADGQEGRHIKPPNIVLQDRM